MTSGVYATFADQQPRGVRQRCPGLDPTSFGPHRACAYGVGPAKKGANRHEKGHQGEESEAGCNRTLERELQVARGSKHPACRCRSSRRSTFDPKGNRPCLLQRHSLVARGKARIRPEQLQRYPQEKRPRVSQPKTGYHIYIVVDNGARILALGDEIFIRLSRPGAGLADSESGTRQLRP